MSAINKLIIPFTLMCVGCATTSREKILQNMAIAAVSGYVAGQQKGDHKSSYSVMYAGLGASAAAVGSLYYYNIDDENKKLRDETKKLKDELDQVLSPKLERHTPGTMAGKIPDKYRNLISPGEWRVYAIDQWVEDGENRIIHQDKIMELIPPTLKPGAFPAKSKEN